MQYKNASSNKKYNECNLTGYTIIHYKDIRKELDIQERISQP